MPYCIRKLCGGTQQMPSLNTACPKYSLPPTTLHSASMLWGLCTRLGHMAAILCTRSQRVQKHRRLCESSGVKQEANGGAAMDRLASQLEVCCHFGIATEHTIYACSFATALCRLCYRASYKMREACEKIFPSSLFGKTDNT